MTNYEKLIENLESLVKSHRGLLDIVRAEREILKGADLDKLTANNRLKEQKLEELIKADQIRVTLVTNLYIENNLDQEDMRLLDLANNFSGEKAERLRSLHAVLDLLLKRVREHNLKNEHLIQEALSGVYGAMNSVKNTLKSKPTYQNKGTEKSQASQSGQLVSRQA